MLTTQSLIFPQVQKFVAEQLAVESNMVQPESDFFGDFKDLDSLCWENLLFAFEDKFGVSINDVEAEEIKTPGDLAEFLESYIVRCLTSYSLLTETHRRQQSLCELS